MTIESITGRQQSTTATKANQKNTIETDKASTASKIREDNIDLSSNASQVNRALEAASTAPVVDNERVTTIKQAIANGSYIIDSNEIAKKMTQFHALVNPNST